MTTGRSLNRLGYTNQIIEELEKYTRKVKIFENITSNPKLPEVKEGIEYGRRLGADIVIGFGGGSSIDAAKAIAAGIGCDTKIEDMLFEGIEPSEKSLPVIAIPTTAGTGSELSRGAIISCSDKKIKSGIRGRYLYPKIAIVDSFYTEKIPKAVTFETGFDVFAHALESYVSKKATLFSENLSLTAIDIVSKRLPVLMDDPVNISAREEMSYASMIMGINLGNVGTALPHRMQYPVGALTDTSHAAGLMALYPSWLRYEWDASKEKMSQVQEIVKRNTGKDLNCFIESSGFKKNLKDLLQDRNIAARELAGMVSGSLQNDPAYKDPETLETIYEQAMQEELL